MKKIDFKKMTLKDMEEYSSDRHLSGKERARNMSIKYKLASITIFVALIPMTVLTILMLFFYNRAIMQRADKQIEENIRIMSDRLSSVLQNGELCSNNLTIEFSSFYNDRTMKQVTRENRIISQLSQSLLIYDGISSIVYVENSGRMFSTDPALYEIAQDVRDSEYIKELSDKGGKTIMMNPVNNPMDREDKEIITMGKHVINIVSGSPIGYIFINMDKNYLIESSQSEISYYFLYDNDGNIITETEKKDSIFTDEIFIKNLFDSSEKLIKYNKEAYLLARDEIKNYKWTVVGITNLNKFNVTGKDLGVILITTCGITAVLLIVSVVFSANFVTRPLKVLHDGAQKIAEGDMSFRFRFKSKDEIGRLGRIFNYMTQRNYELLKQVDDEAKKKREYELALIQEQVKPHFLYNTLDIIIMLIEMNRSKEAARVTQKLANYYKNSLSGSEEIVTIEREIQIIRDYLDLQTMRYGDKFSYEIDVDEKAMNSLIPKMTLQPLVENAIYHGIKNKPVWGKITISGQISFDNNDESMGETNDHDESSGRGYVRLSVSDDGIGMNAEELQRLNTLLSVDDIFDSDEKEKAREAKITDHDSIKGGSHFGLYSVAKRIKLYFGKEYGAKIESVENEGTTVTVIVPF
ncbi:cache domain-containing sensor histidine kinase [Butyrivibrio sp. YAB3001]|uniref:cache domain-containing sensor histidine kinase n=1 Tax=Butyrivibrio sp. YAB3001 TaxID=1520812 RepID=UPI001588013F|nr:histidine kinase [Butyrivibrio sp. YAB3001]